MRKRALCRLCENPNYSGRGRKKKEMQTDMKIAVTRKEFGLLGNAQKRSENTARETKNSPLVCKIDSESRQSIDMWSSNRERTLLDVLSNNLEKACAGEVRRKIIWRGGAGGVKKSYSQIMKRKGASLSLVIYSTRRNTPRQQSRPDPRNVNSSARPEPAAEKHQAAEPRWLTCCCRAEGGRR